MLYYQIHFSYCIGNKPYDALMVLSSENQVIPKDVENWFNDNVTYNDERPLFIKINACTESFFESQPRSNKIVL